MLYSSKDIIEITNEKPGNVEFYRKRLRENGLLENNTNLNEEHLEVFKALCKYKHESETTWEYAVDKYIYEHFLKDNAILSFRMHEDIIINHLIWRIKKGLVTVTNPDTSGDCDEFHEVYEVLIDNFVKIGAYDLRFEDSFGTDGNPVTTFKCIDEKLDSFYYVIGKLGRKSNEEEIHVFFNEGPNFNIMKIQYISGGIIDKDKLFNELFNTCCKKVLR